MCLGLLSNKRKICYQYKRTQIVKYNMKGHFIFAIIECLPGFEKIRKQDQIFLERQTMS